MSNENTIITIISGVLTLAGVLYATRNTRATAKEANETAREAADRVSDLEAVKAAFEGSKNLVDDLTADRRQLRDEILEDRKTINAMRTQLNNCLDEKTREAINFEKRIAALERSLDEEIIYRKATETQLKHVGEYQNGNSKIIKGTITGKMEGEVK